MIKLLHHDSDHGGGGHTHEGITAFENTAQAVKILEYMLEHNKSHAEELHEMCHRLEASGETAAAHEIDMAVDAFFEGNELLEAGLKILKKEQ